MHILITGGSGFVGRAYHNVFNKSSILIRNVDIQEGEDCRDFFKVDQTKYDLIIHLAAIVGGRETIEGAPLSVATDLSIDAEFFNWLISTDQKCPVIYFSSSAAYPIRHQTKGKRVKLSEDLIDLSSIESPDFTYGWAKLTGEYLASFAKKQGQKVHIFRPFSGYGQTQDLDYPFPSFIDRCVRKVSEFEIWGDGTQVRDFIHVDDIVRATLEAVELEIYEPINLGSGIPISFNFLAETAFEVTGFSPKNGIKHLTNKPVGVMYRCSDPTLMESFYKPAIGIEDGIRLSFEHIKKTN